MLPKPTNLDAKIDEAVRAMRAETAPPQAGSAALAALFRHPLPRRSLLPIAVRLAGLAGTSAAVAIAVWPRPGQGLAWAQVVASAKRAPRIHETTQFFNKKRGWQTYLERWADGDKYAIKLAAEGVTVMDTRFDGRRVFRNMCGERYATVATPRDGKGAMGRDLGVMWTSATSIDDFLKTDKAEVIAKKETSLPDGTKITRYEIRFGTPHKERPDRRSHLCVYVDSGTARIVRWEQLIEGGETAARGVVEYPSEVSAGIFEGRASAGTRLYDIDRERRRLASMMKTGIGTLSVKGAKATVRAVLLDRRNSLTVLWTGASPNGDLAQPLRIQGMRFESRPFGLREFTTGRGLEPYSHLPSTVVADHLGGMSQTLKEAPREGIDIEIPVFTEDHKTPIRNKAGKTVGYRSRFVGYDTLRNVKPLQIPDLWSFADELGIRRAPVAK